MSVSHSTRDTTTGRFVAHHTTNHDFFATWSPEMAWCLGYTCADGSIASAVQIGYGCIARDIELLESVKEAMGATHPIRQRKLYPGHYGAEPMVRFGVNSRKMVSDLAELHGVRRRKTYGNPPMPDVPDEYLGHFFRGVFDGDGCFHLRPIKMFQAVTNVVGTELFLNQLADRMHAVYGLTRTPVFLAKHIYSIQWTGKVATRIIYDAMYPQGVRHFCKRKKAAFDAAISAMPPTHCRADSAIGYRGVSKARNDFKAMYRAKGRRVYLGCYKTAVEAAIAFNLYAREQKESLAGLNPIPESTPQATWASVRANLQRLRHLPD